MLVPLPETMCNVPQIVSFLLLFKKHNNKFFVAEFNLSDKQAEAILDISLRKLTSLEVLQYLVTSAVSRLHLQETISVILKVLSMLFPREISLLLRENL